MHICRIFARNPGSGPILLQICSIFSQYPGVGQNLLHICITFSQKPGLGPILLHICSTLSQNPGFGPNMGCIYWPKSAAYLQYILPEMPESGKRYRTIAAHLHKKHISTKCRGTIKNAASKLHLSPCAAHSNGYGSSRNATGPMDKTRLPPIMHIGDSPASTAQPHASGCGGRSGSDPSAVNARPSGSIFFSCSKP